MVKGEGFPKRNFHEGLANFLILGFEVFVAKKGVVPTAVVVTTFYSSLIKEGQAKDNVL